MNLYMLEQYRMVLEVLEQMKDCVDKGDTYTTVKGKPFNLGRDAGICGHLFAHTPGCVGIDYLFLQPVFKEMNLDTDYPVEMQFTDRTKAARIYRNERNKYNPESEIGIARIKLLNDLIQYFSDKIKQPVTETMFDYYLKDAHKHLDYTDPEDAVWKVLDFKHNIIWASLAELIVKEDPTLGIEEKEINYPDEHSLSNVVTTNLQERVRVALESLQTLSE